MVGWLAGWTECDISFPVELRMSRDTACPSISPSSVPTCVVLNVEEPSRSLIGSWVLLTSDACALFHLFSAILLAGFFSSWGNNSIRSNQRHHHSRRKCIYIINCNQRRNRIPGPLTLRMMLREVSSMNSTRTWVTPPRDPIY